MLGEHQGSQIDDDAAFWQAVYGFGGIVAATLQLNRGDHKELRECVRTHRNVCRRHRWQMSILRCDRLLGEAELRLGNISVARTMLESAFNESRRVPFRRDHIETQLAFGKCLCAQEDPEGITYLEEAVENSLRVGYSILAIEARLALAEAYATTEHLHKTREHACAALEESMHCGYATAVGKAKTLIQQHHR